MLLVAGVVGLSLAALAQSEKKTEPARGPRTEERQVVVPKSVGRVDQARKLGTGKLVWRIGGDPKPKANACGPIAPYPYWVEADAADVQDAEVLHIIWHKIPQAGSPAGAIERVIVDSEGDFAKDKSPHVGNLYRPPSDFAGTLYLGVAHLDFCSKTKWDLEVTVIWLDKSDNSKHMQTQKLVIDTTGM